MAKGTSNRAFQGIIDNLPASGVGGSTARKPLHAGILSGRANALADIGAGNRVDRNQEYVDPARCRIWAHHNRLYSDLNPENCADLLESLLAQGKQDIPAIVRRVRDVEGTDYEVVCGARRHWSISWLRNHDYPDFKFLVEVRHLTDEEAFRLSDIENRNRRDISDYERAVDYKRAINLFYDGSQKRMCERLKVTETWMSRYLEIAGLPEEILGAFGSPHKVGITAASQLGPLLRRAESKEKVLAAAETVRLEQEAVALEGTKSLEPSVVLRRLLAAGSEAAQPKHAGTRYAFKEVTAKSGKVLLNTQKVRGGGVRIVVHPKTGASRAELLEAVARVFEEFPEDQVLG